MLYSIVIHKESDSDFGVTVPDLPGCFSAGTTYDEALTNAKEAIACHIEGLLIDSELVAAGKTVDSHINNPDYADGIWALIEIDLSQLSGRAKRINITLPERVLNLIDLYTKNHAVKNRSALIADAAMQYMASSHN